MHKKCRFAIINFRLKGKNRGEIQMENEIIAKEELQPSKEEKEMERKK